MPWLILLASPDPFLDEADFLDPSLDEAVRRMSLHVLLACGVSPTLQPLLHSAQSTISQCGIARKEVSG